MFLNHCYYQRPFIPTSLSSSESILGSRREGTSIPLGAVFSLHLCLPVTWVWVRGPTRVLEEQEQG